MQCFTSVIHFSLCLHLLVSKLCNGEDDCGNNADENEEFCKRDVNECLFRNGGCGQLCVNTRNSYYCKCKRGFKVSEFGVSSPLMRLRAKRWRGCPSFIASSSLRWYSQFHIIYNFDAAPWEQPYVWRHQRVWHVGDLLTQMREYQRWLVFNFRSHPPSHTDEY